MSDLKCIGCGAALQSEDETKKGYIPESGMKREDAICRRCYRLKHYNEIMDVDIDSGEFMTMLNSLYEVDGLIIKVIDAFDINASLIPSFNRIVGDKKVIAVLNKTDLLPKSVNVNRLIHRAKLMLKENGITAVDTVAISALKNHGLDRLIDMVTRHAGGKDVYVVGTTNVGKSTLINQLIKMTTGDGEVITTSRFPGTTLDLIDIPLDENAFIYDTPGVIVPSQMAHYVSKGDLKHITPSKEIKPVTFQLESGQTLFLSGLARVDFESGDRNSFTVYASNHLTLHRTKTINAESFYEKHYNGLLAPPEIESPVLTENAKTFSFDVAEDSDIEISGYAFISLSAGAKVSVHVPKGVEVNIRQTIFKGGS